jgi:DNA-binding NarL/FixJ family response regulator
MIRVLLADDHSIVRAGLRRIVEESGDMEVVAGRPSAGCTRASAT